jgi:hypothetical protein
MIYLQNGKTQQAQPYTTARLQANENHSHLLRRKMLARFLHAAICVPCCTATYKCAILDCWHDSCHGEYRAMLRCNTELGLCIGRAMLHCNTCKPLIIKAFLIIYPGDSYNVPLMLILIK